MLQDVFYFGALRVILDAETGRLVGVQDRISGEAAAFRFRADYIAHAVAQATRAWASTADIA